MRKNIASNKSNSQEGKEKDEAEYLAQLLSICL